MASQVFDLNSIQIRRARSFSGKLTETNHLYTHFLAEPHKMGVMISLAMYPTEKNILSLLTGGIGNTKMVTNSEYEWDVYGHPHVTVEIVQDVTGTTPGIGGSEFTIKLKNDFYTVSDVLVLDDGSSVRVQSGPDNDGSGFCYQVIKIDPSQPFISPTVLKTGNRVSKDWSSVEEYSSRGGSFQFDTPFTLRNHLTTLRQTYGITRSAATDKLIIEFPDPENKGKKTTMWTRVQEWTSMCQWVKEQEYHLLYSIYNKNPQGQIELRGENGRPVYHGAGLREQISPANKRYYSELSYGLFDEFLLDLSYNADRFGGNHNFVALAGKMAMREFDRAVRNELNTQGLTVTNSGTFITGSGENLTFTGHFKTIEFMNGIKLTLQEFPPYDDINRNRLLHPKTRKPIESYRITILNFGLGPKGIPNIQKVAKEGSEDMMWYVPGSIDPISGTAPKAGRMSASGIDGYEVHRAAEIGIMLADPLSCGELILDIDGVI